MNFEELKPEEVYKKLAKKLIEKAGILEEFHGEEYRLTCPVCYEYVDLNEYKPGNLDNFLLIHHDTDCEMVAVLRLHGYTPLNDSFQHWHKGFIASIDS